MKYYTQVINCLQCFDAHDCVWKGILLVSSFISHLTYNRSLWRCLSEELTVLVLHFASAAVAVDSSHMTASSSTSWSRFSPPSDFVSGHVSTMWFMVWRWPQSQEGDWVRPHLCKFAWHGPWPVQKQFSRDHVWRGRSKPGCWIVGPVTIVWLTTETDNQSSLHFVIVSTDVMSDHTGHQDASLGGGCSKTSAYTGQFGWASMIGSILSVGTDKEGQLHVMLQV